MNRRRFMPWLFALLAVSAFVQAQEPAKLPRVSVELESTQATVGQHIPVVITLDLAAGDSFAPAGLGNEIGAFSIVRGAWLGPEELESGSRWLWRGEISTFRPGAVELPPVSLTVEGTDGDATVATEPITINITSVLDESDPELADLKPPASIAPDFSALRTSAVGVVLLLIVALVAWWVHRRFAARLAAAEIPDDPFHRTPPHVWVYSELQRLLEERLPEQGEVERFYRELSRILKSYLSGRYRVDLLEQTSCEVPQSLHQAGAPEQPIEETVNVLGSCDQVKFAKVVPGPEDWKSAVEEVYRIVDQTRPAETPSGPSVEVA